MSARGRIWGTYNSMVQFLCHSTAFLLVVVCRLDWIIICVEVYSGIAWFSPLQHGFLVGLCLRTGVNYHQCRRLQWHRVVFPAAARLSCWSLSADWTELSSVSKFTVASRGFPRYSTAFLLVVVCRLDWIIICVDVYSGIAWFSPLQHGFLVGRCLRTGVSYHLCRSLQWHRVVFPATARLSCWSLSAGWTELSSVSKFTVASRGFPRYSTAFLLVFVCGLEWIIICVDVYSGIAWFSPLQHGFLVGLCLQAGVNYHLCRSLQWHRVVFPATARLSCWSLSAGWSELSSVRVRDKKAVLSQLGRTMRCC